VSDRQDAAVRYARAGWPVFPTAANEPRCDQGPDCRCKVPLTRHGLHDAETDPRIIARWWARHPDANVAIATGAPGPTVLDVDRSHGKPGYASLRQAQQTGLVPSPMAAIRTPSGGAHLYYYGDTQGNGSMPRKGLDLRGKGGYVVAPPSVVHGRPYVLVGRTAAPTRIDFAAIREHLEPRPEHPAWHQQPGQTGVGHLADFVARLEEGNRNTGTFWAACRAVEAGDSQTLATIARAAVSTGLDQRAVAKTIASAQRMARPRGPDREAG
jgi:hypothetical protein